MITLDVMTRNKTVMVRLSDEEHQRLSVVASGQGATLAGYLRAAAHQQLVRCPQTLVVVARPPFEAGCVL